MKKTTKILIATVLAILFASVCGTSSTYALSGVATQEVYINVLPHVPNTGEMGIAGSGGSEATPNYVVFVVIAVVLTVIFLTIFKLSHGSKKRKPIVIFLALLAVSSVFAFGIFKTTIAAPTDPTIELDPDILNYTLRPGESATLDFAAIVTTDVTSADYTLSAISDNTNEMISLDVSGGDLSDPTELPTTDIEDPLLLKTHEGNATNGDKLNFSLKVGVSENIPVGRYKVIIVYLAATSEGESFMFTIDTRMMNNLDTDAMHLSGLATTFSIPTSGYVSRVFNHNYDWIIDWGDGTALQTVSGVSNEESPGISHDYASAGEYQITIRPNGRAMSGWLDAFGFYNTVTGANTQANKNMLKSLDSMMTDTMRTSGTTYRFAYMFYGARNAIDIPEFLFSDIKTSYSENVSNMFNSTFAHYATNSTAATIPAGLFASVLTSSATDASNLFNSTFFNYAHNSTSATIPSGLFAAVDVGNATNVSNLFRDTFFSYANTSTSGTIPADLFASIQLAPGANVADSFGGTFYSYASSSTSGTIPAGLFSTIDTTNASSIVGMFSGTFSGYANASTSGTIPADLFAGVNTANQTETSYLFNGTFSGYAQASNTTIPSGLFAAVDTSKAENLSSTFAGTFNGFANNSTVATIPAGLFSAVNTVNASNLSNMFRDTFSNYAGVSTVATIPAGLFDAVDTAKAVNTPGMFSGTFYFYGHASPVAAIPANLFTKINLSSATNVYEMFYRSFDSFAYTATAPTDINNIWGGANFAGRVTADNVSSFFNSTFSNVTSLTGAAQTFIDGKLGGIVPATVAHTFAFTAVTDYAALDVNWK